MIDDSYIPIFLSTDNTFAVPTYIALFSLLLNYCDSRRMAIYVLTTNDFSEENVDLLSSLTDRFSFAELVIMNMGDTYHSVKINNHRLSVATMYRLFIPQIMKQNNERGISKCIYLDSDVIVEGDITELFNYDLDSNGVGGVIDRDVLCEDEEANIAELGIPSMNKYINAGVLLLDTQTITKRGFDKELVNAGSQNAFRYNDQDVVNSVCYDMIKVMPDRFNIMNSAFYRDQRIYKEKGIVNIKEALKDPVIIHFNTYRKPWSYRNIVMAKRWWKYVDLQEENTLQKYIRPFLSVSDVSFEDRIKETIRTIAIDSGIYDPLHRLIKKIGLA